MENNNIVLVDNNKNKKELSKFHILLIYFLFFSFIGWISETLYSIYELGHFTKRGFLYGPICPIYGWGALILIIFFNKYREKNIKLFFYAAIIFSMFEYSVSYGMDAIFASKWWDYTNEFFNLNGRISILYSFIWGISAILFVNHIYPFFKNILDKLLLKISYKVKLFVINLLIAIFFIDTILSFIKNLI